MTETAKKMDLMAEFKDAGERVMSGDFKGLLTNHPFMCAALVAIPALYLLAPLLGGLMSFVPGGEMIKTGGKVAAFTAATGAAAYFFGPTIKEKLGPTGEAVMNHFSEGHKDHSVFSHLIGEPAPSGA